MHVLFSLIHKSAEEVAYNLQVKVFAYFGIPKILQSDNDREFVNVIVQKLVEDWPGEITIINGRPRHPQSQGLIEKGNSTVEAMLACKLYSETQAIWTSWLPEIQCKFRL